MCALVVVFGVGANIANAQGTGSAGKTRLAVIGLDHDHVWSLLKDVAGEPSAEFRRDRRLRIQFSKRR